MGMKFMNEALSKSLMPKYSLVTVLREALKGQEVPRSLSTIHASEVTKDDFCARRVGLLDKTGKPQVAKWIPAALRVTFDMGRIAEKVLREKWLEGRAVGHWHCTRCDAKRSFTSKPPPSGGGCLHHWSYDEVQFVGENDVSGSPDVLVDLGAPLLFVVECKIMAADEWDKILAPLAEHRIRSNLYLRLIENSQSPHKAKINTQEARLLYLSRGYGRMHPTAGEILPFKEFIVRRDDSETESHWKAGLDVKKWRENGSFPKHLCATLGSPLAKKCPVASECFSGQF